MTRMGSDVISVKENEKFASVVFEEKRRSEMN